MFCPIKTPETRRRLQRCQTDGQLRKDPAETPTHLFFFFFLQFIYFFSLADKILILHFSTLEPLLFHSNSNSPFKCHSNQGDWEPEQSCGRTTPSPAQNHLLLRRETPVPWHIITPVCLCACVCVFVFVFLSLFFSLFSYPAVCDFLMNNNLLSVIRAHEAQDAGWVVQKHRLPA